MSIIPINSPLQLIIQNANPEAFASFLQTQPIDFYSKPQTEDNQTILHQIVFLDLETLFFLLMKQLRLKCSTIQLKQLMNNKDSNGNIALFYAVFKGNLAIVKCLIDNGSEVGAVNNISKSVLHFAAEGDQTTMLIYFKDKYKQDILQKDIDGSTPLHYCCYYGSLKAVNFILSWVSDKIDIVNYKGETPLYFALYSERTHMIKKLLMKGANPYIKSFNGQSIIDIARNNTRFSSIYEMIINTKESSEILHSFKRQQVYSPTAICVLLTIIASTNAFLLLPRINSYYHTAMYYLLLLSLIVYCSYISMSDSGIVRNNKSISWLDLVELNVNVDAMCPYCRVKKDIKVKHCHLCNHCIVGYDHHCDWINNCVGNGNNTQFIGFLIDVIANLTYGYYIGYKYYYVSPLDSIKVMLSVALMSMYILLLIPVMYILYTQMSKILLNNNSYNYNDNDWNNKV